MIGVERMREEYADRTALPAVGPLSELIRGLLASSAETAASLSPAAAVAVERLVEEVSDPLSDDDLQLALYLCFELHYRSFPGVDDAWEWSPGLLAIRAVLERAFLDALAASLPTLSCLFVSDSATKRQVGGEGVGDLLFRLEAEDEGVSLSRYIEARGDLDQVREFLVHRSLYQLKEADPHSWAIPRIGGAAKTALLEDRENAYLDRAPGFTLATVNLMSAFGLRRSRRGALVGHLAMFEMTSSAPNRRYGNALRRLGFDGEATDFFDEHVEADAVHENIAAYDLAGALARAEPELAADILFGARALLHLEDRVARGVLAAWDEGRSSLRRPLTPRAPQPPPAASPTSCRCAGPGRVRSTSSPPTCARSRLRSTRRSSSTALRRRSSSATPPAASIRLPEARGDCLYKRVRSKIRE